MSACAQQNSFWGQGRNPKSQHQRALIAQYACCKLRCSTAGYPATKSENLNLKKHDILKKCASTAMSESNQAWSTTARITRGIYSLKCTCAELRITVMLTVRFGHIRIRTYREECLSHMLFADQSLPAQGWGCTWAPTLCTSRGKHNPMVSVLVKDSAGHTLTAAKSRHVTDDNIRVIQAYGKTDLRKFPENVISFLKKTSCLIYFVLPLHITLETRFDGQPNKNVAEISLRWHLKLVIFSQTCQPAFL